MPSDILAQSIALDGTNSSSEEMRNSLSKVIAFAMCGVVVLIVGGLLLVWCLRRRRARTELSHPPYETDIGSVSDPSPPGGSWTWPRKKRSSMRQRSEDQIRFNTILKHPFHSPWTCGPSQPGQKATV
jgi:hypothetical protein